MTFKIIISQFYDSSEPKQWNETKSDVFSWDISEYDVIHFLKY